MSHHWEVDLKKAGALLGGYRKRAGFKQAELCYALFPDLQVARPEAAIGAWETGRQRIAYTSFPLLKSILHLSAREADELAGRSFEELKALDSEWLAAQPVKKQAGLYLRALRIRSGMTIENLAEKAYIGRANLGMWERGNSPIRFHRIADLQACLGMSPEEADTLRKLSHPEKFDMQSVDAAPAGQEGVETRRKTTHVLSVSRRTAYQPSL